MKTRKRLMGIAILALAALSLASCKKESIDLSLHTLWFSTDSGIQEIKLTSNCSWSVSIDDGADWYTIDPMSGKNDATLYVTVQTMERNESRTSTFTVTSSKGNAQVQVRVSQNTDEIPELTSITNMIFGVENAAHWNTDFFGEVVEDSYIPREYDPADTATGHTFYFLEDAQGIQQSHIENQTYSFNFTYNYNPVDRIFHIEFETVDSTVMEVYDAPVLVATEEQFRIYHEWLAHSWEMFDMKKIGTISQQDKSLLMRRCTKKRKGGGGILQF